MKKNRWISALALAAVHALAGAQSAADGDIVWVENESFGFEACSALNGVNGAESASATLAALRSSAAGEVREAVRLSGVAVDGPQRLTLTPVEGRFACGADDSQVTFRLAAVDSLGGKFWSADLTVRAQEAATDRAGIAALAADLAQSFRGVVSRSAGLR